MRIGEASNFKEKVCNLGLEMLTSSSEKTSQVWESVFIEVINSFPIFLSKDIFNRMRLEEQLIQNSEKTKNDFVRIGALRLLNIIVEVVPLVTSVDAERGEGTQQTDFRPDLPLVGRPEPGSATVLLRKLHAEGVPVPGEPFPQGPLQQQGPLN